MITEEEKQEIINAAVEKALLMIPEVVGNMMANHATFSKMNSEFYTKYPEFKDHKKVVATVIEMVEGNNTFASYEKILELAVPEIRKRIATMKTLDVTKVTRNPSRDFSQANNGEL